MIRLFDFKSDSISLSSTSLNHDLAKIFLCFSLRASILMVNIMVINNINSFFSFFYFLCLMCFIAIIQITAYLIYRSWIGTKYDQTFQQNIQEDSPGLQLHQTSHLNVNLSQKQAWIFNILWHLIMSINAGITIFSFLSLCSFTLNTYVYKLRSMLCFMIFEQFFLLLLFLSQPYFPIETKSQNSWKFRVNKQKQIIKVYSAFEVGFIKYLGISFAIGSLLDYISYGNSDYINYKYQFNIYLNGNRFTFNQFCFYLSLIIFSFGILLPRKIQIIDKIRQFIDFQ